MKVNNNLISQYLIELARERPECLRRFLRQGDKVAKNIWFDYEIDNPDIYKQLGDFPEGTFPYSDIHGRFRSDRQAIANLFMSEGTMIDGKKVVPYSRAFQLGIGECAEKAIATHLFAQNIRESYIVTAVMTLGADDSAEKHAFNIIFRNGKGPVLLDVENPRVVEDGDKKRLVPYIVPIIGVYEDGVVQLPEELADGRTYNLFR